MKSYKTNLGLLLLATMLVLPFTACDDDPSSVDEGPGEEELITLIRLTLTELDAQGNATTNTTSVSWEDADGEGGNAPTIGTLSLAAGTSYSGTIELLDTTQNPPEDITEEVEEEAEEHQFFYELSGSGAARVTVTITDEDANNLPVGLEYLVEVSAGGSDTASLNVVLSHYDEGPKNGTDRSDESDIDIDIPVNIQ